MTSLTTFTAPAASTMSRATEAALAAYQADTLPVGWLDPLELMPMIGDLLNGAALLLAHKNALDNPLDLKLMAHAVAELVQRRFAGFKFAELSEAFRRGASGEYKASPTDVLYLSLPNINNWFYAYQTTARHEAIKAVQASVDAAQLALPPVRRDLPAEVAALLTGAIAGRLAPAAELDFANVCYDWLKQVGAFNGVFTSADYADMRAEETEAFLALPQPQKGREVRLYRGFVETLAAKGEWPAGHPLAKDLNNACKKRVLREWLLRHAVAETEPAALRQQLAELETDWLNAHEINLT